MEYLELDLHPAAKSLYTPILTQHRKNKILILKDIKLKEEGVEAHTIKANPSLKQGAAKKGA